MKNIFVADGFEEPTTFKIVYIFISFILKLSKFLSIVSGSSVISYFKRITSFLGRLDKEKVENIKINQTKINNINVNIYTSDKEEVSQKLPAIIFYHGGGYVFDDLGSYNYYLSSITKRLNLITIAVNYKVAPEFPYPGPINDCYEVTKYVLENSNEFNIDPNRIALAGDSAGGNAVAVISQRLLLEKKQMPKLQILIYPWLQMFNFCLPSAVFYYQTGFLGLFGMEKFTLRYLGIDSIPNNLTNSLRYNNHYSLIQNDKELIKRVEECSNVDLIPEKYKLNKKYYSEVTEPILDINGFNNLLNENTQLKDSLMKAFTIDVSPILADLDQLKGLPKAYFIIGEWDSLKDESIIYSERLKQADVVVNVAFYENLAHGLVHLVNKRKGFESSRKILNDLVDYIGDNL